jgi:small-conductance mechanosensitive channel
VLPLPVPSFKLSRMSNFLGIRISLNPWSVLPLIILATAAVAYLISIIVLKVLKRTVPAVGYRIDDPIYRLFEIYLFPLLIVVGLLLIEDLAPLPPKILRATHALLVAFAVILVVFLSTKAVLLFLRNIASRYEPMRLVKGPIEIAIKIVFLALGGMIILDNLGVSITPLITTLGIGSLAVAIALQDTLGNFFAGLYIKADRPVQVGHYVRLESGEEGYVDHIGWRNTRVRMLPNNIVVVPNVKLVQSNITNYYLPEKDLAVLVQVGVHYDSDLEKVEKVTCAVAKEVLKTVPGGVATFEPFIRYHTFNQSSIDFTVILRGQEFTDNFLIKHEFIKKLHSRYRQEGITIPFPIRTVHLESETEGNPELHAAARRPDFNKTEALEKLTRSLGGKSLPPRPTVQER